MGLVASVVLGAETPVHVWEDGLFFEVYCAKDTAAYFRFPSADVESREKRGLSAFSTFLAKKHGDFYTIRVKRIKTDSAAKTEVESKRAMLR